MQGTAQTPEPTAAWQPVYDLRLSGDGVGQCLERAAALSAAFLDQARTSAGEFVDGYAAFARTRLCEPPRSWGEYAIELLNLGVFSARYGAAAHAAPRWATRAARALYRLRRRARWTKPAADALRARLVRAFLMPRQSQTGSSCPAAEPERLLAWLRATGEFEQEAARLTNWLDFLKTLPQPARAACLDASCRLAVWFETAAEAALGSFTRGVQPFLAGEYARRGCREDQLFCGKDAIHYHLALVTAAVMNQGLRAAFLRTRERVVLAPACLRGPFAANCRARENGVDIECAACTPACPMNRLTAAMREQGVTVYMVPHSASFSRWLERWEREPGAGVTAVACLLNILPGGYEMRARGIPSQCLPLSFPGCERHWARPGRATSVDHGQLVRIVSAQSAGIGTV